MSFTWLQKQRSSAGAQLNVSTRSYIVSVAEKIVPSAVLPVPGRVTLATLLKRRASHKQAEVLR